MTRPMRQASRVARPDVNIAPFYWYLWAQRRRSSMAQNGYPKQVPFYQPPRAGDLYLYDPKEDRPGPVTDEDIAVVEGIEAALAVHRRRRPLEVQALEVWEGAFVGADPEREARVAGWSGSYASLRKAAWRAKLAVERYMYTT